MAYVRSGDDQLKQQLMKNSTLVCQGSKAIYQIHTETIVISGDIRKCQLGTAKGGSIEKVIMMVGATGSGKTTMIDAMFNHVVDVKLEDPYRFRLVDESVQAATLTQADSQTDTITAYTLHHQEGFAVPYTLTIVDTPGFGDTRGKEHDKKMIEQIRLFFTTAADGGIDHFDAVGFVVNATQVRLTENKKYIFDSVLSIWGNNIREPIFMIFTFAGQNKPAAFAALDLAEIPYEEKKCYKFNNSALYGNEESGGDGDDDDDAEHWNMNIKSFHTFLTEHLIKALPTSMTLSQTVLDLRRLLEICQNRNKTDLEKNKNFTFEIENKIFGMIMIQRLINETLQEIALQPADKTVGWEEHDYIEHMIQTEKRERKDGWIVRTQKLQKLQKNSEELSNKWNRVFVGIHLDFSADPKLSTEDNKKLRKWQKIVLFKQVFSFWFSA